MFFIARYTFISYNIMRILIKWKQNTRSLKYVLGWISLDLWEIHEPIQFSNVIKNQNTFNISMIVTGNFFNVQNIFFNGIDAESHFDTIASIKRVKWCWKIRLYSYVYVTIKVMELQTLRLKYFYSIACSEHSYQNNQNAKLKKYKCSYLYTSN